MSICSFSQEIIYIQRDICKGYLEKQNRGLGIEDWASVI